MRTYSHSAYLAFSITQDRYATYFGTTPPHTFEDLEHVVASSHLFALWYSSPHARIYRLLVAAVMRRLRGCGPRGRGVAP